MPFCSPSAPDFCICVSVFAACLAKPFALATWKMLVRCFALFPAALRAIQQLLFSQYPNFSFHFQAYYYQNCFRKTTDDDERSPNDTEYLTVIIQQSNKKEEDINKWNNKRRKKTKQPPTTATTCHYIY